MFINKQQTLIAFGLVLLMLLTRSHHFSDTISLPDASLAVFFLAGLWLARIGLLLALLIAAVLIDYVAISHFNVSDFCVSPAYVFLLPAYCGLWLTGKFCQKYEMPGANGFISQLSFVGLAITFAFVITNGSFYLWSGRYPEQSWDQYIERFFMYYPPYLTSSFIYIFSALAMARLFKLIPTIKKAYLTR